MLTHVHNVQHTPRVVGRLQGLLDAVRRWPGLSTGAYAEACWGRRAWDERGLRGMTRTDLDRLWSLGLVLREHDSELARDDGVTPATWYWHATETTGSVREALEPC